MNTSSPVTCCPCSGAAAQKKTEQTQTAQATHARIDASLERLDRHTAAQTQALTALVQWGSAERVGEVLSQLERLYQTQMLLHTRLAQRHNGFSSLLHRILGGNHDRRA